MMFKKVRSVCIAVVVLCLCLIGGISASAESFSVYVIDSMGCRIDGWYSAENDQYYIFMTSKDNIADVDVHYTSDTLDPDTSEFQEQILENAFSLNDSITLTNTSVGSITLSIMQADIPSLFIDLNGTTLAEIQADKDIKYPGNSVILEDPQNTYDLTKYDSVEIKGRGNTSWDSFSKKGYQIKFDKKTSVLGMPKAKKWCLIANASDDSMMKNYIALNLAKSLDMDYAIDCRYVDLWIEGEYQGLYLLTEKAEIGENRVNLTDEYGALYEWDEGYYYTEDYYFFDENLYTFFTDRFTI